METFAILLLLVFVPFGWYILRMLQYTDETIGEHSPIYRERTYQLSASQYFVTFDKVMWVALFIMMWVSCRVIAWAAIRQDIPWLFLFVCVFAGFALYLAYVCYVDWQYWTITRNVVLTLNPFDPSIQVDGPRQSAVLTPASLQRIELHIRDSENPKDPLYFYGYYLFYAEDGTVTQLNKLFFHHIEEFIERYFGRVPFAIIKHKLPPLTPLDSVGN